MKIVNSSWRGWGGESDGIGYEGMFGNIINSAGEICKGQRYRDVLVYRGGSLVQNGDHAMIHSYSND